MTTRRLAVQLRLRAVLAKRHALAPALAFHLRPFSSFAPLRAAARSSQGSKPTVVGRLPPATFTPFRLIREFATDTKQPSEILGTNVASKDLLQQQWSQLMRKDAELTAAIKELSDKISKNEERILDENTSDSMRAYLKTMNQSLAEERKVLTEAMRNITEKMAPSDSSASVDAINQSILGPFLDSARAGPIDAFNRRLTLDTHQTKWLQSLPNAEVSPVLGNSGMTAVVAGQSALGFGATVASNILFVRDFYGRLLQEMWKMDKAVLIGNPGLGKSILQTLIVLCLVDPDKLGIMLDFKPKLVVRETVGSLFEFFILEQGNLQAYEVAWEDVSRATLINALDPAKCLYLYDPASTTSPEPVLTERGRAVKTIATVSPYSQRVKEFLKKGGSSLYMPVWTEDEIMDARQFMCDRIPRLDQLFSEGDTKARFERFGGIFRHVFPESPDALLQYESIQADRIEHVDLDLIIAANATIDKRDMDGKNVSGYLLQYDVDKRGTSTTPPFRTFTLRYASNYVRRQIVGRFDRRELVDTLGYIERSRKGGSADRLAPALESATHRLIERGAAWEEVDWTPQPGSGVRKNENVPLPKAMKWEMVNAHDVTLKADTLAVFGNVHAPFIESAYPEEEAVRGLQIKSGKTCEPLSRTACLKIRKKLKLGPSDQLAVWYVLLPERVEKWKKLSWEELEPPVLHSRATEHTEAMHAVATRVYEELMKRSDVTVQTLVHEMMLETTLPREVVEAICTEQWTLAHVHELTTVGILTHPFTIQSLYNTP